MNPTVKTALLFASLSLLGACSETRVRIAWPAPKPQPTNFVAPAPSAISPAVDQVATAPLPAATSAPIALAPPAGASSAWAPDPAPVPAGAAGSGAVPNDLLSSADAAKPPTPDNAGNLTGTITGRQVQGSVAPAPTPPPIDTRPIEHVWQAKQGEYLRDVLDRWVAEAHQPPVVYALADPTDDWTIDLPLTVHGDFEAAVKALCDGVHTKTRPIPFLWDNGLVLKEQI